MTDEIPSGFREKVTFALREIRAQQISTRHMVVSPLETGYWWWQGTTTVRKPVDGHQWPPVDTEIIIRAGEAARDTTAADRVVPDGHTRFWLHTHAHPRPNSITTVPVVYLASAPGDAWMSTPSSPTLPESLKLCPVPDCIFKGNFRPVSERTYLECGGGHSPNRPLRLGSIGSLVEHRSLSTTEEAAIRRALLQRLVDRAELLRTVWAGDAHLPDDCCTVAYRDDRGHERMVFICDDTCRCYHHHLEVWIG